MIGFSIFGKLERLSAQRHPLYESHRKALLLTRLWGLFAAGYVVLISVQLAHYITTDMVPPGEPYPIIIGTLLLVAGVADFWLRFAFQTPPAHRMRPYLLLPIPRKRLVSYLLMRAVIHPFNLYGWCFCLPLALLVVYPLWGGTATAFFLAACFGLWMLNLYGYLLCRNLLAQDLRWLLLPLALQGGAGLAGWYAQEATFGLIGEGMQAVFNGHLGVWMGFVLLIVLMGKLNERLLRLRIYEEESRETPENCQRAVKGNRTFFARWGAIGRYMDLETKLLLRNRFCRNLLRNTGLLSLVFAILYTVTPFYEKGGMEIFIPYYLCSATGITLLSRLLSFEGNYLDGWMVRQESLLQLLKAKYAFYGLLQGVPLLLLLPALLMGKGSPTTVLAFCCINIGFNHFILFQLALYQPGTSPLNEEISRQPSGQGRRLMAVLGTMVFPLSLYYALAEELGRTVTDGIFMAVGVAFTAAAPYWIGWTSRQWMKKKYEQLDSYRNSRR